ncbi:response regulator [Magnetospirillum sp. UT-4]|uniref:response regulator n=1 Tax=Magnetospirillum sp. UT-4 TaxID=2681467 RepID=UPI00137F7CCE|nr:response regulator [Magnetospirillum sp. UT-4]CAA7623414.1 Response regulator receiver protein [Magnetospirillum sp. UT-4]
MNEGSAKICTVLLVEDVPADAHLTRAAFEEGDMRVDLRHAEDGRDGLDYLRRLGRWRDRDCPRPHLILLDLNMPRMDGREFLAEIKRDPELATIPVVMLTTSDVQRDVMASYRNGAAGYVVKPVEMTQFIDAIRSLEKYWLSLVALPQAE